MNEVLVNHYVDKKLVTEDIPVNNLKLEIRAKMVVLTDDDNVVFACKLTDFISLHFCKIMLDDFKEVGMPPDYKPYCKGE